MPNHEVISAFLDNEPFDANELGRALGEPDGRELLLDLVALRAVVQDDSTSAATPIDTRTIARQRRLWIAAGFAAASLLFGVGSVLAVKTLRLAPTTTSLEADVPPHPNRVVTFEPGLEWHDVNR
jgi:hypothetical protein